MPYKVTVEYSDGSALEITTEGLKGALGNIEDLIEKAKADPWAQPKPRSIEIREVA